MRLASYRGLGYQLSIAGLCDAVSINLGDTRRDANSISDELEILRWCSSLVRRSADGAKLELAHFTVKEFLLQIDDNDEGEFAIFRIGPGHDEIELAKVCLTYLSFRDFDDVSYADREVTRCRIQQYPLREYAVFSWFEHAKNYLGDSEVFSLTKQLLNPSKPGTFVSWVQDILITARDPKDWPPDVVDTLIAGTTPLHFAAMLRSAELCVWLIEGGCDVNRNSIIGSPLYCYLTPLDLLIFDTPKRSTGDRYQSVTRILLDAGADPDYYFRSSRGGYSLLSSSLDNTEWESATELLEKGAKLDETSLAWLEKHSNVDLPGLRSTIEHIRMENVQDEHRPRVLKLSLKVSEFSAPNIFRGISRDGENAQLRSIDYDAVLRTAAQFGQVQVVTLLLRVPNVDLQAVEDGTGFTALHYAAINDHPEIVKLLWTHGAQYSKTDNKGRTAVHHAAGNSSSCLEYFWEQGVDNVPHDNEGFTLWHQAAYFGNTKSLDVLSRYHTPTPCLNEMKTIDG